MYIYTAKVVFRQTAVSSNHIGISYYNSRKRTKINQKQGMYNAFISYSHATDDKFAPSLQSGLQKFAKPWYKKRNLEIFRDESSLSASPKLWDNITSALEKSEYLILLASPASENSKWVSKEIEYWLEHKSIDNILLALTEGKLEWNDENKCFLNPENNSLPPVLDNKFDAEPFYIDLRLSKTEEDLSLSNPIFKKEVLKLAAKLHGVQPNDLASEEVTVHRKMKFLRNAAISALFILFIGVLIAGIFANEKRKQADKNKKEAVKNLKDFKDLKETTIGATYQGGKVFQWDDTTGKSGMISLEKDLPETYTWEGAKLACDNLSTNGYDDWRLPTREEIAVLYANRILVGGFKSGYYWSLTSYEGDSGNAFFQSFVHGDRLTTKKSKPMFVRAVRKFKKISTH